MTPSPDRASGWQPILEGEAAARALAAVEAVALAIGDVPVAARHAAAPLAGGEAGVALLFEYLERARPGAGYRDNAARRLDRAIEALASSHQMPTLFSGFTGIAWVAEHLQGGPPAAGDGEEDEADPNEDIDAALLHLLRQRPWSSSFDLTGGLVGLGVYALERLPRASAAACLELVVEHLAAIAEARPDGLAWYTPVEKLPEPNRPWYPQGWENLGMAHGSPGVIALLARVCAAGLATRQARELLSGAVSRLLAQRLPAGGISIFPFAVGHGVRVRPARTAWCYGDPGIAAALLAAGRGAGEPAWEREAAALAREVARRPPASCGVEDAGLCHGAAGLGHVLNRLYQATGEPELLAGARAWFGRALEFWEAGRGIGGFLALTPPEGEVDDLVWNAEAGFLAGSAGVALALLAAVTSVDPAWDRVLLLSPLR